MKKKNMNETSVYGTIIGDGSGDSSCLWETVKLIDIPKTAHFINYSGIEVTASSKVSIISQENSALWLNELVGIEGGVLDPNIIAFDETIYKG